MTPAKIAVVGAGPAGVAAAVQLRRCGLEPTVYERGPVGGLLHNAHLVENYPGFPDGIAGPELAARLEEHLRRHDVALRREEVTAASFEGDAFVVEAAGSPRAYPHLIVASGTRPREFPGLAAETYGRVFYDAYRMGDVSGKRVVVVGAGDAAFDYALNLGRHSDVLILGRGPKPRCIPPLASRVAAAPSVEYRPAAEVSKLDVTGLGVDLTVEGPEGPEAVRADYVLLALGRDPEMGFVGESFMEKAGKLEVDGRLYFVGDVRNGDLRQAAIAAGDGLRAAMRIYKKMKEGQV
jgi:thioredoxin reductase